MTITEVLPGVYVGNQFDACDAAMFRERRITRVVNCTPDVPFYFAANVDYMRIPVQDSILDVDNDAMARALPGALQFIFRDLPTENNGVLIHCHAGVSRSCTVAAAAIRLCCARDIPQAIGLCLSRRPQAFFRGTQVNFAAALHTVFPSG